jgi:uncharacterized protein (TIGR01777 family)
MSTIIITGGSGLIGSALTHRLRSAGHTVRILSRSTSSHEKGLFQWNPRKGLIDKRVYDGADCLIHLAGENSWSKPLTDHRKQALRESRIDSLAFLFETMNACGASLKTLVSASAIGYYAASTSDAACTEDEAPSGDFWGTLCTDWENEALRFQAAGIRTVILRTSLVLTHTGGFLPPLLLLVRLGGAVVLGNGKQHYPWIHLDDVCRMYQFAIEQQALQGVYNAAAPDEQTNRSFVKHLASHLKKRTLLPCVPSWCIRLALGKRAGLLLEGRPVSPRKITEAGFEFIFPDIETALKQEIP